MTAQPSAQNPDALADGSDEPSGETEKNKPPLAQAINELLRRTSDEVLLQQARRLTEAPDDPAAYFALATLLLRQNRPKEAAIAAAHCIAHTHDYAEAYDLLAKANRAMGRLPRAIAAATRATQLQPGNAAFQAELAVSLEQSNETQAAIEAFERAFQLDGDPRHLVRALTCLPLIYRSVDHIISSRRLLQESMEHLPRLGLRLPSVNDVAFSLFLLAYHGCNDRPLMEAMAAFVRQAVPEAREAARAADPARKPFRRGKRKLRLGLISQKFKQHTIGRLFSGLVNHFPRDDFEIIVFSPSLPDDPIVRRFREGADKYLVLPRFFHELKEIVARQKLDILFYTDIGMDPWLYGLSFFRLAPVQLVSWGHPVTTGVPTIDYFLSSEALEIEGAEDHYSEALLKASRVTACYERPETEIPELSREDLGLPANGTLYLCPQTPMKLHPEFDEILEGILRRDPTATIAIQQPWSKTAADFVRERLKARLDGDVDRIVYLPFRSHDQFLATIRASAVMLDPMHFGGGNTNYEACHVGTPVVTLPSRFMRGRFCYALYRQMGIEDTIAGDKDDYVDKAIAIATDPARRQALSARILERSDRVFDDRAILDEVAEMLIGVVEERQRRHGAGTPRDPAGRRRQRPHTGMRRARS